jgi:ABC-type transport system involved in multi-copper enzyme maturation permease subunit
MAERTEVVPLDEAPAAVPAAVPPAVPRALRAPEKLSFSDALFLAIENPVLRRELLTALRSNKAFVLHFLFLFALGTVVWLAWPEGEVATRGERARQLFRIFGVGHLVLLSVLSPAFSASSLTLEKEARTIDLLLTSPIQPNTILAGKYLSSVLYIFLLVLSTAPIVSVISWMPGIDAYEVAGLYVLLLAVAACFGMIGLACSTFFHRTQGALSITYLIVLPLAVVLMVFAYAFDSFFQLAVAIWPSAILLVATVIMYQACLKRLREPFDPVFKAAEEEDVSTQTGLVLVRDRFPDNLLAPPRDGALLPDHGNPVFQKELRCEIFGRGTLFLRLIIQISMFLSVVFLTFLYLRREYVFVDYLLVFTMLVAPAFASNTFTQERERGTLDLLLTTLVTPAQIVTAKFLSCLRLSLFLTGLVGVTLLFYLLVGGSGEGEVVQAFSMRIAYFCVYVLILAATIVFETALGMFCSLVCSSTLQSMILTYAIVLIIFGVPIAAQALLLTFASHMDTASIQWSCFISPFQAVHTVTPKAPGGGGGAILPPTVWPAYLGFTICLSTILLGYVYASFERWTTRTPRAH